MVTFHTAAVVARVAPARFAAEQEECAVETRVLTGDRRVHLQGRRTGLVGHHRAVVFFVCLFSVTKEPSSTKQLRGTLTCSRRAMGRRHSSHSSRAAEGRPLRPSHAGFPPTLLGNCGARSRHGSASSRKPSTTAAEDASAPPDMSQRTYLSQGLLQSVTTQHNNNTWTWVGFTKAVREETPTSRCLVPLSSKLSL